MFGLIRSHLRLRAVWVQWCDKQSLLFTALRHTVMSTASFSRFSSSSTSANLWTPQRATGRLFRSLFVRANSQHANFSSTFLPISKCDFSSHTMSSKVLFVWLNYALCWGLSWLKTAAIHQTVGLMLTWTIWRITDSQHTTSCYIPCLQQVTVKTAYFEHG